MKFAPLLIAAALVVAPLSAVADPVAITGETQFIERNGGFMHKDCVSVEETGAVCQVIMPGTNLDIVNFHTFESLTAMNVGLVDLVDEDGNSVAPLMVRI